MKLLYWLFEPLVIFYTHLGRKGKILFWAAALLLFVLLIHLAASYARDTAAATNLIENAAEQR